MVTRMYKFTITTFVCIAAIASLVNCEIFSSTTRLSQLPSTARLLVYNLQEYIQQTEEKLAHIRKYLKKLYLYTDDTTTNNSSKHENEVVETPIMAFKLIKLLSSDLNDVRSIAELDHWKPITEFVEDNETLMPNEDDVEGAIQALIRLQGTYNFNIKDMSQGSIPVMKSVANLTVSDLLLLGKVSFHQGDYAQSVIWFQNARNKAMQEGNHTSLFEEIEASLSDAIKTHNTKVVNGSDIQDSIVAPEYAETFGYPISYKNKHTSESFICKRITFTSLLRDDFSVMNENYKTLCRGENSMKTKPSQQLICRLETKIHPFLLIQPLKVEQKNLELPIVLFHDLLTDSQVEKIKELAEPEMDRSTVVDDKGGSILHKGRISQNSWLSRRESPLMTQVYKLAEIITGLLTKTAEMAQIANYGMGGYYGVHPDYFGAKLGLGENDGTGTGDRIATLMFYLSDVEAGGATAFPNVGAGVHPKKGSAVFWYNLKKNGEGNPKSKHAGCPVIKGNKWIMNIWIRVNEQMFRRPCGLRPDA